MANAKHAWAGCCNLGPQLEIVATNTLLQGYVIIRADLVKPLIPISYDIDVQRSALRWFFS